MADAVLKGLSVVDLFEAVPLDPVAEDLVEEDGGSSSREYRWALVGLLFGCLKELVEYPTKLFGLGHHFLFARQFFRVSKVDGAIEF